MWPDSAPSELHIPFSGSVVFPTSMALHKKTPHFLLIIIINIIAYRTDLQVMINVNVNINMK